MECMVRVMASPAECTGPMKRGNPGGVTIFAGGNWPPVSGVMGSGESVFHWSRVAAGIERKVVLEDSERPGYSRPC